MKYLFILFVLLSSVAHGQSKVDRLKNVISDYNIMEEQRLILTSTQNATKGFIYLDGSADFSACGSATSRFLIDLGCNEAMFEEILKDWGALIMLNP